MNCKFANLKLALKKYINVPKWEQEDTLVEEEEEKGRRGIPYVHKKKINFEKRPQTGKWVVSKVLTHLLQNVGDIIVI